MDMSFMSKFLVQGPDAGPFLNWLSTNDVDGPVSRLANDNAVRQHRPAIRQNSYNLS